MTLETVVLLLIVILALLAAVLWLLFQVHARLTAPPPPEPEEPGPTPPQRSVPDAVKPAELDPLIGLRMAGTPASGASLDTDAAKSVVWVEHGDEAIFHVDSVRTAIVGDALLVALDLETDQMGRQTLVVPLAVGSDPKGGITIACEAAPRGPDALVRRWGEPALQAVIAALLELVATHARERAAEPVSLHVADGRLRFGAASGAGTPGADGAP